MNFESTTIKVFFNASFIVKKFYSYSVLTMLLTVSAFAQSGTLTGSVIDSKNGEQLIGANLLLEGTNIGAATDLDGKFIIKNIAAGSYNLFASMIGYTKVTVTGIVIKPNEIMETNISLSPEAYQTEEVIISAKLILNNENSLLKFRQKSNSVSDAISSELISRMGSSNAADAMNKVTGVSVVSGKYIYVRGLGDRYSSTQLNGTELPSADPDKKSFNLDLFPANILDNITTIKSFTPDKPGSFSGGIVDISTKKYPDKFTLNFSSSSSFNSLTTFNSEFLTYSGGSKDWLGYDDGKRSLPALLADPGAKLPSPNSSRRNSELAYQLDELTKSFNPEMSPISKSAPVNQSYSFSMGDQYLLFNKPLGFTASFSYNRDYKYYDGGAVGRWELSGKYKDAASLNNYMYLSDSKGVDEVLMGGIVNLALKAHPNHDISLKALYTRSGESTARFQEGKWDYQLGEDPIYQTRSLLYTERNLNTYQLNGEHFFSALGNLNAQWIASFSSTQQNEPDLRFFSNDYQVEAESGERIYSININSYNAPTRFFRKLSEENKIFNLDLSLPFYQWNGLKGKLKFGGAYQKIGRSFTERRFELRSSNAVYSGDIKNYFVDQAGIIDSSNNRYLFGTYIFDASSSRNNYSGDQTISAGYLMFELPVSENLKFISGARYEITDMTVESADTNQRKGILDNNDLLPSAALIYQLQENMNLRASYGKTLARPNFREMAPFRSFEFLGDFQFVGVPDLKRTLIDNFDLRWEWFERPGELYAVSAFYKNFQNPIERTLDPTTEVINYQNVERGSIYGAEFEIRKRLDVLHNSLSNFMLNINFSLIRSKVDIPKDEYEVNIFPQDSSASKTRPLFGQSPYLVNLELSYFNTETGTTVGLFYNIFGSRLSEVTLGATPDVYEQPRGIFDLTFSQKMWFGFNFKFSAKNLLNSPVKKTIEFKGNNFIYHQYNTGRSFSVGVSYSI